MYFWLVTIEDVSVQLKLSYRVFHVNRIVRVDLRLDFLNDVNLGHVLMNSINDIDNNEIIVVIHDEIFDP